MKTKDLNITFSWILDNCNSSDTDLLTSPQALFQVTILIPTKSYEVATIAIFISPMKELNRDRLNKLPIIRHHLNGGVGFVYKH